jgi:hypothetical protein
LPNSFGERDAMWSIPTIGIINLSARKLYLVFFSLMGIAGLASHLSVGGFLTMNSILKVTEPRFWARQIK